MLREETSNNFDVAKMVHMMNFTSRCEMPPAEPIIGTASAIVLTVASVIVTFLYTLILDFSAAFVKAPKHFPKRGWFPAFPKREIRTPYVEVSLDRDYEEALARGAKQVSQVQTGDL